MELFLPDNVRNPEITSAHAYASKQKKHERLPVQSALGMPDRRCNQRPKPLKSHSQRIAIPMNEVMGSRCMAITDLLHRKPDEADLSISGPFTRPSGHLDAYMATGHRYWWNAATNRLHGYLER
jgi:hypothetical protein